MFDFSIFSALAHTAFNNHIYLPFPALPSYLERNNILFLVKNDISQRTLEDQRDLQLCNFITCTIAVNEFIKPVE